jgi:UDP-2,4-diacetamido-2,4,6-trideoxy-beta-L-altropyranose hydrolase
LWEVCYLGIPAFVIVLADNQQGNARVLDRLGAAVSVGPASSLDIADLATHIKSLALDPNRRQTISRKARGLVDGRGVSRVLDALDGLIASEAAKPRCSSER